MSAFHFNIVEVEVKHSDCVPENRIGGGSTAWTKSYFISSTQDFPKFGDFLKENIQVPYSINRKKVAEYQAVFSKLFRTRFNDYPGGGAGFDEKCQYLFGQGSDPIIKLNVRVNDERVFMKFADGRDLNVHALRELLYEGLSKLILVERNGTHEIYPVAIVDSSNVGGDFSGDEERRSEDCLTVALKLFATERIGDWCGAGREVNQVQREHFGAITSEQIANWTANDIKELFLGKNDWMRLQWMWSGSNGTGWAHIENAVKEDVEKVKLFIAKCKDDVSIIARLWDREFNDNRPSGFGKSVCTELLMKFHPDCEFKCGKVTGEALQFLGLLDFKFTSDYSVDEYAQVRGIAAMLLGKIRALKLDRAILKNGEGDGQIADYLTVNEFLWFVHDNEDLIKEKVMEKKYKPTEIKRVEPNESEGFSGFIKQLEEDVNDAGLKYAPNLMKRFVCAQLAKPFVVLTGLSGSGKTKLAQAFTKWIAVKNTSKLIPVGADWTNSEKLLGYPNALAKDEYVMPDTGVLRFILDAALPENNDLPFFLILDEMNLSHVERYFADFLSAMESGDEIKLYDGDQRWSSDGMAIPKMLKFPKNLFVIGTMNVDETTYMFSPKVLDRAQVIEFRVKDNEMADFVGHWKAAEEGKEWVPGKATQIDLSKLADTNGVGKGAKYAESFLMLALKRAEKKPSDKPVANESYRIPLQEIGKALNGFFKPLAELGAEFGYRSASEILSFCGYHLDTGAKIDDAIDAAIVQKLLPKLHGSRRRLEAVLFALWKECLDNNNKDANLDKIIDGTKTLPVNASTCRYPLSAEKIFRMRKASLHNGFASFAEA